MMIFRREDNYKASILDWPCTCCTFHRKMDNSPVFSPGTWFPRYLRFCQLSSSFNSTLHALIINLSTWKYLQNNPFFLMIRILHSSYFPWPVSSLRSSFIHVWSLLPKIASFKSNPVLTSSCTTCFNCACVLDV